MRYLQQNTVFKSISREDFLGGTVFYILLFTGLLMFPLTVMFIGIIGLRKKDTVENRSRNANALASKYLTTARKKIKDDNNEFYEALEKALYNYLKAKLRIDMSDINKENIGQMFIEKRVPQNLIDDFIGLLSGCEFARYTPVNKGSSKKDYEAAKNLIAKLNSYF